MARFPGFRLLEGGAVSVDLDPQLRALLSQLPSQLVEVFDEHADDPALRRLSPPAYLGDAEAEAEFRRFTSDDLDQRRREHLGLLAETAHAERLDAAQAEAWLTALNALRLYLGTSLDVSEETDLDDFDDESDQSRFVLLHVLGEVQDTLLSAVAGALPPPRVADDLS